MKIEKLEPSKHKEGRWLIWLEDASIVRIGEGDVVSLGLYTGKELSDAEGEALAAAGERSRLMERAVGLLSLRPMSRKELLDKLCAPPRQKKEKYPYDKLDDTPDQELLQAQREAVREQAEAVADRLTELGLLNDGEYARMVVRHYAAKGYGPRKLRDELYRRGVPREYWEDAMEEREPDDSQIDKLARQKLRGAEPTRENLKKVSDYLARRGYGWDEISSALERLREEEWE
ncbi:MAG: recombination regulator RecX [Oscillospiraceae bacterium]|nr:recombination regulator RecX [Oscillospiraceae bacterium]MDE7170259.1 recombination regulator RecX [Oscillospiraceae bacterium]